MNLKKQTSRGVVKRSKEVLGPLIFRTTKTSVFSKNTLSKFVSIVLDSFLGLLHLALTVSLYLCISGSNAWGEGWGPWRALCQLKKTFKCPRQRPGSSWEERKKKLFPEIGVLDLPSRQINFFTSLASLIFDCLRPPGRLCPGQLNIQIITKIS